MFQIVDRGSSSAAQLQQYVRNAWLFAFKKDTPGAELTIAAAAVPQASAVSLLLKNLICPVCASLCWALRLGALALVATLNSLFPVLNAFSLL